MKNAEYISANMRFKFIPYQVMPRIIIRRAA